MDGGGSRFVRKKKERRKKENSVERTMTKVLRLASELEPGRVAS